LPPPQRLAEHFVQFSPEFKGKWDEHLAFWQDQERGDYIDLAVFAHFLVDCYAQNKTERFPEIFGEVERLLNQGGPKVREVWGTIAIDHDCNIG
jgi:hypothetical protein